MPLPLKFSGSKKVGRFIQGNTGALWYNIWGVVIAKDGAMQHLEQRAATTSRERILFGKHPSGKTAEMDDPKEFHFLR